MVCKGEADDPLLLFVVMFILEPEFVPVVKLVAVTLLLNVAVEPLRALLTNVTVVPSSVTALLPIVVELVNLANVFSEPETATDVPDEPLVPLLPELPEVPLVPEVPLLPLVPDVPLVPEVPSVPLLPELPDVPDVPALPDVPLVPLVPDVPEVLTVKPILP